MMASLGLDLHHTPAAKAPRKGETAELLLYIDKKGYQNP